MSRNLILLLLFLLLGGTAWYVMQQNQTVEDTFSGDAHTQFALEDTDVIQRIFLANRSGDAALVEKQEDDSWVYTNKTTGAQFRANPNIVWTLLETIRRIRVRYPVGKAAEDNAVRSLAASGTKVEIYDKDKNKLRVFTVGAMTDGAMGNFINMDGSNKIYVAYIPNNPGTIDTRFVTREEDWRDKAIFRNNIQALEFVELDYQDPSQKAFSFRITREGKEKFSVLPLDESVQKFDVSLVNQANAQTYIEDFDVVAAEKILYDKPLRDSIITTSPFAIVRYKASYHNQPQSFKIYPLYNPNADRGDGRVGHRQKIQRYFIDIDKDNFFLAQHIVLRKILWSYSFFFQKEAVELLEDEASMKEAFQESKNNQ